MRTHGRHEQFRDAIVGVAAVAAIALAAASIGGAAGAAGVAETPPTGGLPVVGGPELPGGGGTGDLPFESPFEDSTTPMTYGVGACVRLLAGAPGAVAYFGLFAAGLYGLKRRYNSGTALLGFYAASPVVLVGYFASTNCASAGGPTVGPGGPTNPGPGPGPGVSPALFGGASPVVLGGVLAVVLVGAALVVVRLSGGRTAAATGSFADDGDGRPDVEDLAAAAGRAADRMEAANADVDNEVYRAWWRMTQLLDVADPETATPREFARAARSAGIDPADADQLTTLFEEVRYGERDPGRREDHAVSVFREIETAHGERRDDERA